MHRSAALVLVLVVAGCAQTPPREAPPAPAPAADPTITRAVARHRTLAEDYRRSGDLPRALAQWQVVALLDPADARARDAIAEIRAQSTRAAADELATGRAAQKAGDAERASSAFLRTLAVDPGNAEAAARLRDLERQRATRTQAERAARAGATAGVAAAAATSQSARTMDSTEAYELEQGLEMFRAGDTEGGLRELRGYVAAHPGDRAARQQIGSAAYERGRDLEARGSREEALRLFDQAIALRGEKVAEWSSRADRLRKQLGVEYYERGVAAYPGDPTLAMRLWTSSLQFDPGNAKAAARLAEARKSLTPGR